MDSKTCNACGLVKLLNEFHVNRKGKFGRQAKCKGCTSATYYEPNKAKVIAMTQARRQTEEGRQQEREWQRARRLAHPIKRMMQEAKARADKRGFEFSINESDVDMPTVCPVLGIPIGIGHGARADGSPSIDRIDTRRGYVAGNVRVISWRANRLKNDATLAELRAIVRYVESALGVAVTAQARMTA